MSAIFYGIVIVLLMLLGVFALAVVGTLIACPISDFFECRKLYNRVKDISLGCKYWDRETCEQKFKPVYCICRDKEFKVEVKQSFSCYGLNVMAVYINEATANEFAKESAVTVWKSESLCFTHYGHDYNVGKNCTEVKEIIKSAQKVSLKMWEERIDGECRKDSYFE